MKIVQTGQMAVAAHGAIAAGWRLANQHALAPTSRATTKPSTTGMSDGVDTTGPITIPNTGGFLTFQTICRTDVTLLAGRHIIRLLFDTPGASGFVGNLNWFEVVPAGPPFPGNANHDGLVGFDDLLMLAQNYGKPGTLESGDFNQDGHVGFDDLLLLAHNYGKMDPVCAAAMTAVPGKASIKHANVTQSPLRHQSVRQV